MTPLDRARQLVIDAVKAWREAVCAGNDGWQGYIDGDGCYGDNHIESCPCELARQDLIAASNKLELEEG